MAEFLFFFSPHESLIPSSHIYVFIFLDVLSLFSTPFPLPIQKRAAQGVSHEDTRLFSTDRALTLSYIQNVMSHVR